MKKSASVSATLLFAFFVAMESPWTAAAATSEMSPETLGRLVLPEPEWGPVQTEHYWAGLADGATETSTAPRMRGADETTAEGVLETFGTRYMPNEYDCYRKARETAKESEQILRENFPGGKPNPSARENRAMFDRVEKACAKAVSEMFRRHDELCHFYFLHKLGALSDAELSEIDEKPVLVMLPYENRLFKDNLSHPAEDPPPSQEDLDFAAKYLPEINAAYQAEKNLLEESRKLLADLTAEARLLDAPRAWDDSLRLLSGRIDWTVAGVNFYAKCMKENRLAHAIGETTAEALSAFDQTTGANYQKTRKDFPMSPMDAWYRTFDAFKKSKRIDEDMFWRMARVDAPLHILPDDMVRIPGKDCMMCRIKVTEALWAAVGSSGVRNEHNNGYSRPSSCRRSLVPSKNITWEDANGFIEKLNSLPVVKDSGLVYRLPTLDEWMHAFRAGATSGILRKKGGMLVTDWLSLQNEEQPYEKGRGCYYQDADKFPGNAWGFLGMYAGWLGWKPNLQEWTSTKSTDKESYVVLPPSAEDFDHPYYSCRGTYTIHMSDMTLRLCANVPAWRNAEERKAWEENQGRVVSEIVENMVQIPGKPFKMGKTEVTQRQWESIMGSNPSEFKNENNPVENVSWDDCQKFLDKLNEHPVSKESGLTFRLPNHIEWEFACRAGAEGPYCLLADGKEVNDGGWFSSSSVGLVAWFDQNSDDKPHPVGLKMPNAFGLYDMNGNVWEWSSTGITASERRVNLGGSWKSNAMRVAVSDPSGRHYADPRDTRSNDLGFRLCADSPEPK